MICPNKALADVKKTSLSMGQAKGGILVKSGCWVLTWRRSKREVLRYALSGPRLTDSSSEPPACKHVIEYATI